MLPPRTTVSSDGHDEKQPSPPTILSSAADVVALTTSEGVEDDDETSSSDALPPPELLECDVEPPEQSEEAEVRVSFVLVVSHRWTAALPLMGRARSSGKQMRHFIYTSRSLRFYSDFFRIFHGLICRRALFLFAFFYVFRHIPMFPRRSSKSSTLYKVEELRKMSGFFL